MGLAELFLGKENPISQYVADNRNTLRGAFAGLGQGANFSEGLGTAALGAQRGAIADDAFAVQQEAEAKRLDSLNKTAEFLRSKGYEDLLAGVESGGMDMGAAWTEALRRGQPTTPTADWAKLNDGTLFNQRTGETMPLEGMEPGVGGFVDPKEAFNREKDIAAQYGGQDPVKTYQAVRSSYERVRKSAEIGNTNPDGSGAADISLVFAYMKMLDPTSVVREGEFAAAANAGGVPAHVLNMYNNLVKGDKLTPEVRQQFVQQSDAIYQEVTQNLESLNDQYSTRATGWGVNPSNFIHTPEQYEPLAGGGVRMPNGNTVRPL